MAVLLCFWLVLCFFWGLFFDAIDIADTKHTRSFREFEWHGSLAPDIFRPTKIGSNEVKQRSLLIGKELQEQQEVVEDGSIMKHSGQIIAEEGKSYETLFFPDQTAVGETK